VPRRQTDTVPGRHRRTVPDADSECQLIVEFKIKKTDIYSMLALLLFLQFQENTVDIFGNTFREYPENENKILLVHARSALRSLNKPASST
jgi:hypothetical protein